MKMLLVVQHLHFYDIDWYVSRQTHIDIYKWINKLRKTRSQLLCMFNVVIFISYVDDRTMFKLLQLISPLRTS